MRWNSGIKSRDSEGKLKSSGDMIVEISKKLAQFKDGPGKAAVAMDLNSKSGAQLLPMLKDLEESGELVVKVTAEQANRRPVRKTIRRLTAAKTALQKRSRWACCPSLSSPPMRCWNSRRRTTTSPTRLRSCARR